MSTHNKWGKKGEYYIQLDYQKKKVKDGRGEYLENDSVFDL